MVLTDSKNMCPNKKIKKLLPVYIVGLAKHKYTYKQAMESTGYSRSHLALLVKRYKEQGDLDLENKNKNRHPVNRLPQSFRDRIVLLYNDDKYNDTNFKFFTYCLNEFEGINVCYKTVRNIMIEYGIKSPEARKIKRKDKVHRPRLRRDNEGDLLQLDATPYPWFYKFGDDKRYALHGAIDDATSKPTAFYMTENECSYGYFELLRQTINNYGIPRQTYTDRAAIFCVTPKEKQHLTAWEALAGVHDKRTQWQRVLDELGIDQILAWSPQAKGRVERMWHTVQDWLPTLFYINGIDTMEKANKWLPNFVKLYCDRFSVAPRSDETFYISAEGADLDEILTVQIPRLTNSNGTFSFHSYPFAVEGCDRIANKHIMLHISEQGIFAKVDGKMYNTLCLEDLTPVVGENFPQVVQDLIYRYCFAYAKEISA